MGKGGSSLFLRDEVWAQDGITFRLPMSHRLVDPMHFLKLKRCHTVISNKSVLKGTFSNYLKVWGLFNI